MARLRPVLVAVVGVVVLVAGCGGQGSDTGSAPDVQVADDASTPVTTSATAAAEPAKPAPKPKKHVPEELRFTAKTVDGKNFRGASLAGKPAMLWFWAPWCSNCQAEAPDIAEAAKTSGVQFVGVAAQDQVSAMQDFVDRFGLGTFPHIADTDAAIWKRFGVTYQPAYAFVSSKGHVEVEKDILDKGELLARVDALH
jgi:thiol-disulfide isomerase/thioredoxin